MTLQKKFWISLTFTLLWMVLMGQLIKPLNSKQIVAFEFAHTVEVASSMVQQWTADGIVENACISICLDFVFLILYTLTISLALFAMAKTSRHTTLQKLCHWFAYGVWFAALCDAIENIGLLQTLSSPQLWSVTISFYAASIKFIIILVAIFILMVTGVQLLLAKTFTRN